MRTVGLSPTHIFWPLWITHCLVFGEWISQQSRKKCTDFMGLTIYQSAAVCVCACTHMHACMLNRVHLMDCSPPGSSVHGIFQARTVEWVAIFSFRGSCHGCSLLQGGPLRRLATSALLMGVVSDKNPSDFWWNVYLCWGLSAFYFNPYLNPVR